MARLSFDPTLRTTTPGYTLGDVAWDSSGNAYTYVQADGAITERRCAVIGFDGQAETDNAASNEGRRLGVATAAFADNEYGWLQIYGNSVGQANAAITAGAYPLDVDGNGEVDDATVANGGAFGIVARAAQASANQPVDIFLHFPFLDGS